MAATTCPVRLLAGSAIIRLSWRAESDFLPAAPQPAGGMPAASATLPHGPPRPKRGQPNRTPMPSFEWNKIIASVLTAMIVAMVSGILASQIVRPKRVEQPVYLPPGAEGGATAASAPGEKAAAAPEPIAQYIAKADPKHGEQVAKACLQWHTFCTSDANDY